VPPTEDEVLAVQREARRAEVRVPTLVVPGGGLPRPLVLRGLRWSFVLAAPTHLADPGALVDVVKHDRRWGDDRLAVWLTVVAAVHAGWASALRFCTTAVRPGSMRGLDRVVLFPFVLLAPVAAIWCGLSWVAVQVAVLVTPRHLVDTCLELLGTARWVRTAPEEELVELGVGPGMGEMLVNGSTERVGGRGRAVRRTRWNTPRALSGGGLVGPLDGLVATLACAIFVGLGTFSGFGQLAAQRIVWPWEEPAQRAVVTSVEQVSDGGPAARIGVDVGVGVIPTVRLDDGEEITLPEGANDLRPGDQVQVVVPADGTRARSTTQDSLSAIITMGLVWVLAAIGMLRVANGVIGLGLQRRLAQIDHEQRVLTGRRHRRRAPKDFLGMDFFRS
jgi:hypothetical protein